MTQAPSHQTIRLKRGWHRSPRHGACVMELASMLAGEPFGDHPRSVCPVVASFLRAYNDGIDEVRRQDLYELAALVVGTAGDRSMRRRRAQRCADVLGRCGGGVLRQIAMRSQRRVGGAAAAEFLRTGRHAEAVQFVRDLVGAGGSRAAMPVGRRVVLTR
jgi:hypothetical protein